MKELQKIVDALLERAVKTGDSGDALKYTQAALNAAHTKHALDGR